MPTGIIGICSGCNTLLAADGSNTAILIGSMRDYCLSCVVQCGRTTCSIPTVRDNSYIINGVMWCKGCTLAFSFACDICNIRYDTYLSTSRYVPGHGIACESCMRNHFWQCPCSPDDFCFTEGYCKNCQKNKEGLKRRCPCGKGSVENPIHDYSCRPNLVFHGKSKEKIHMGFELETQINGGRNNSDITRAARYAILLQELEIAELKSDSSIGGGFEIVTQPHTYEKYREQKVLWDTIDELRANYKARSWDTDTCGLHIHISRQAFRDSLHTHRFIEFIYRNPEMLMKFSGRKSGRYATFSDCWFPDEYEQPQIDINKKIKERTRMSAVNINNAATLELRFFRGTMLPAGVLSALGLAHAMVQYTRQMVPDVQAIRELVFAWQPFSEWVLERATEYPELVERLPLIRQVNLNNIPRLEA